MYSGNQNREWIRQIWLSSVQAKCMQKVWKSARRKKMAFGLISSLVHLTDRQIKVENNFLTDFEILEEYFQYYIIIKQ